MKAFVAGATGETGRRIVRELVKQNIPVKALVRDLAQGRECLADCLNSGNGSDDLPGVELVTGDVLKIESLRSAVADCTVLLCATGARPSFDPTGPYMVDYEGTKNLVRIAKEKNLQHFVLVSSLCDSKYFHPLN